MEVKQPGPGHDWVPSLSARATDEINASLAPHADGTLDIVYAE
jgi:hypothetical protein